MQGSCKGRIWVRHSAVGGTCLGVHRQVLQAPPGWDHINWQPFMSFYTLFEQEPRH